ncbi:MAG: universal stress protein [Phycisphaerales bacterium]|nr:universal stress protein [Phycisphaerales bacterium]
MEVGRTMYRVILIPLENSSTDAAILEHIRPLAKLMKSRLVLIHVADGFAARNQEQLNLEDSEEIVEDRAYLERRCVELSGDGLEVTWRLACGNPADQILAVAEIEHCDLIALSTHGHRFVKDVLLGSVANSIRHRTNIPILMVRAPSP